MKIITKYDDKTKDEIDYLKRLIFKIEMEYSERIDKDRFTLERKRVENDYKTDHRIISLQTEFVKLLHVLYLKLL